MSDFSKLLKSGLLDEETTKALQEAVDAKVAEKLEEEKENLREEFARKASHDKTVMVEAADKMFNDTINEEIQELRAERASLTEEKVKYKKMIREHASKIEEFVVSKLHEEVQELRIDRKTLNETVQKFHGFAIKHLSEELAEFHQDKRDLVETKVKLIKEAREKIAETKTEFINRAAKITEGYVEDFMRNEMKSLHQDIREARQNNFGRKIYEAFVAEHMSTNLSDGSQMKQLMNAVKERDAKLDEAMTKVNDMESLLESANKKARLAESKLNRDKKLNALLAPLPKMQKEIMGELLENVPTANLTESFKKHIKFVLNDNSESGTKSLTEGKEVRTEVTGNKARSQNLAETIDNDLADFDEQRLQILAGIKK